MSRNFENLTLAQAGRESLSILRPKYISTPLPSGGNAIWGSLKSTTDGDAQDGFNKRCRGPPETDEPPKHGAFLTVKW